MLKLKSIEDSRVYVRARWHSILDQSNWPEGEEWSQGKVPYSGGERGPLLDHVNLKLFADIDDLIRDAQLTRTEAIQTTLNKSAQLNRHREFESLEAAYHRFKRDHEIPYRTQTLASALLDQKIEEAAEQVYRLSFVTDVDNLFKKSE